jgi:hypothetical protein
MTQSNAEEANRAAQRLALAEAWNRHHAAIFANS